MGMNCFVINALYWEWPTPEAKLAAFSLFIIDKWKSLFGPPPLEAPPGEYIMLPQK